MSEFWVVTISKGHGLSIGTVTRVWGPKLELCTWVMLNPSTADADQDDPTIRRCIGFTRRFGYDRLEVVNLFAVRATDPRGIEEAFDPIGQLNDQAIVSAARRARLVVCAWGRWGALYRRGAKVLALLKGAGVEPFCLGVTQAGYPKHPLYLPAGAELLEYGR